MVHASKDSLTSASEHIRMLVHKKIIDKSSEGSTVTTSDFNEMQDKLKSGEQHVAGLDLASVDMGTVMDAVIRGQLPITVQLAVGEEFNHYARGLFMAAKSGTSDVRLDSQPEPDDREAALHLLIASPEEAGKHQQLLTELAAEGRDVSDHHIIVVDTTDHDSALSAYALVRNMVSGVSEVEKDQVFNSITSEGSADFHGSGITIGDRYSDEFITLLLAERFDQLSDDQATELLPGVIEGLSGLRYLSEHRSVFCEKLVARYGDALFEDPVFDSLWQSPDFLQVVGLGYVAFRFEFNKRYDELDPRLEVQKKLRDKLFSALGMNDVQRIDTTSAWSSRRVDEGAEALAADEIKAITSLFAERLDSIRRLYRYFGIRNFSRYSKEQLLQQLDDREKGVVADHVTLVVSARDDWNGAFSWFARSLYKNEELTTPEGASEQMIFVEAASSIEMTRRLISIARHTNPINRLLVAAHGSKEAIYFGKDRLTIDMVESSIAATRLKRRKIIEDDLEVILKSCSVGKKGGIAQTIARKAGVEVIGAIKDSSARSFIEKPRRHIFSRLGRRRAEGVVGRGTHYLGWSVKVNRFGADGRRVETVRQIEF